MTSSAMMMDGGSTNEDEGVNLFTGDPKTYTLKILHEMNGSLK